MTARRTAAGAAVALAGLTVAFVPAGSAKLRHAQLTVESEQPAVVQGRRFVPREWVTLTLSARRTWTRTTRADANGRLRVRFAASIPPCTRFSVRAWGSAGTRAMTTPGPMLDCVPSG